MRVIPKNKNIGVITTSTPIDSLSKEQINKGYRYLESKGYQIIESDVCRKRNDYMSGSIEERVSAIHDFVRNPNIDIIMSFWGGTNTNQILPYLDFELIRNNPKVFIGYSDTSALLLAITKKTGLITYHGPSVITYSKPDLKEYCFEYFIKAIEEDKWEVNELDVFADDLYFLREKDSNKRIFKKNKGIRIIREGVASGEVVVSNLQTLLILAGTEYFPNIKDKVLFVEEAEDESVQMIDRFFTHLSQLEDFRNIKALVVGKFMEDSKVSDKQIGNILSEISKNFDGPVIYDSSFGHTDPIFTIPNGGFVQIDTGLREKIGFCYRNK